MRKYVLFNPNSGGGNGQQRAHELKEKLPGENLVFCDVTKIDNYARFLKGFEGNEDLIICGGDGTLNRFVNDTAGLSLPGKIYYYPAGTGNDFLKDVGKEPGCEPFLINDYIKNLPVVSVKGKDYKFINAVGYGLDGYCCEVGDEMRAASSEPVNYTSIAVKGLLFHYKPARAKVTVDGNTSEYKRVWLAPTMKGRFYGGGMMAAPDQDRLNKDGLVSLVIIYKSFKLKTLIVFPSIFKGEHVKHTEMVKVITGHDITVEFDRPASLQIDGETILDVTGYSVHAQAKENRAQPADVLQTEAKTPPEGENCGEAVQTQESGAQPSGLHQGEEKAGQESSESVQAEESRAQPADFLQADERKVPEGEDSIN